MVTERDLIEAIQDCEKDPVTYQKIQKLASLYTVRAYLYGNTGHSHAAEPSEKTVVKQVENVIGDYGDSEFLQAVCGMPAADVWEVIDELLEVLRVTNPRLYDGVLRKLDK